MFSNSYPLEKKRKTQISTYRKLFNLHNRILHAICVFHPSIFCILLANPQSKIQQGTYNITTFLYKKKKKSRSASKLATREYLIMHKKLAFTSICPQTNVSFISYLFMAAFQQVLISRLSLKVLKCHNTLSFLFLCIFLHSNNYEMEVMFQCWKFLSC